MDPAVAGQNFDGLFADVGYGYRYVDTSASSSLSINGRAIPSTLSSGQPSNALTVITAGYNFPLASGYVLGIGASISPASGQAQQVQIRALNQTIYSSTIKPLYSYGFFLAPGLQLGDGLAYLKLGTQTQVNNASTSPNFNGYLLGIGYKQLIYQSIYVFGEANYTFYGTQVITKNVSTPGRLINASITSSPQGGRLLLGLGYQF